MSMALNNIECYLRSWSKIIFKKIKSKLQILKSKINNTIILLGRSILATLILNKSLLVLLFVLTN